MSRCGDEHVLERVRGDGNPLVRQNEEEMCLARAAPVPGRLASARPDGVLRRSVHDRMVR
ncbi:hypothetical protein GCM10027061_10240 [Nesterenkonia suensis]